MQTRACKHGRASRGVQAPELSEFASSLARTQTLEFASSLARTQTLELVLRSAGYFCANGDLI